MRSWARNILACDEPVSTSIRDQFKVWTSGKNVFPCSGAVLVNKQATSCQSVSKSASQKIMNPGCRVGACETLWAERLRPQGRGFIESHYSSPTPTNISKIVVKCQRTIPECLLGSWKRWSQNTKPAGALASVRGCVRQQLLPIIADSSEDDCNCCHQILTPTWK